MKRALLRLVIPALLVTLGLSQAPAPTAKPEQTNIKGCLGGSDPNYTVVEDGTGHIFKIPASTVALKPHLGHDVTLIGRSSEASSAATDSSFAVTELNMISEHCAAAAAALTPTVGTPPETAGIPTPATIAPAATASTIAETAVTPVPVTVAPAATASAPAETVVTPAPTAAIAGTVAEAAVTPAPVAAAPAEISSTPTEIAVTPAAPVAVTVATPEETAAAPVAPAAQSTRPAGTRRLPVAPSVETATPDVTASMPAETPSTPAAADSIPAATESASSETPSTPAVVPPIPTAPARGGSFWLLIAFAVLVIVLGTMAPLVSRWRKRKLLERTGAENLSLTPDASSEPGKGDQVVPPKAA